ncbi:hypothetical protein E2C01_048829 [Portunus trituberculatus]|uniref:Uncharacterized protein n=1 Tax=Portunus trituberculatus TaxID=210409 RepID=A0A5B7G438_PORTR|nr:hypothetical protein [Portunus trituberculatus]
MGTMGQNNSSNPLRENLESLHNQMMKHAGADYDIATTTTLTYDQFLTYITQLNQISSWFCLSLLLSLSGFYREIVCVTMSHKCMKCSHSLPPLTVDPHGECLSCREVDDSQLGTSTAVQRLGWAAPAGAAGPEVEMVPAFTVGPTVGFHGSVSGTGKAVHSALGTFCTVYGGGVGNSYPAPMPGSCPTNQDTEVGICHTVYVPMPGSQTLIRDIYLFIYLFIYFTLRKCWVILVPLVGGGVGDSHPALIPSGRPTTQSSSLGHVDPGESVPGGLPLIQEASVDDGQPAPVPGGSGMGTPFPQLGPVKMMRRKCLQIKNVSSFLNLIGQLSSDWYHKARSFYLPEGALLAPSSINEELGGLGPVGNPAVSVSSCLLVQMEKVAPWLTLHLGQTREKHQLLSSPFSNMLFDPSVVATVQDNEHLASQQHVLSSVVWGLASFFPGSASVQDKRVNKEGPIEFVSYAEGSDRHVTLELVVQDMLGKGAIELVFHCLTYFRPPRLQKFPPGATPASAVPSAADGIGCTAPQLIFDAHCVNTRCASVPVSLLELFKCSLCRFLRVFMEEDLNGQHTRPEQPAAVRESSLLMDGAFHTWFFWFSVIF